jgi:DNA-binding helix-hairpin-helix protein with protein kinase domain
MRNNSQTFIDQFNIRHSLAEKIGSGGEGDVYELSEDKSLAAKIYKEVQAKSKLEKLALMTNAFDQKLSNVSAWPKARLYNERGTTSGFLMPRVIEHKPVHELFNPAARKRYFPEVDYSFLVQAAKNVVAAFATVHSHGFVIGDVNEGNVLVSKSATIKLIDCDSFQVSKDGLIYPCEVGIPMYTPPELQHLKSFRDIDRTINHDKFGMAIICFQLLFMGRHPFVGLYNGPDTPLEKAIEKFWFSYGNSGLKKGIKPPSETLPFYSIPINLQHLFERSFTEQGVLERPNVMEWLEELDFFKKHLRVCKKETKHKYYDGLSACPWCDLENNNGIYFFIPSKVGSFNLSDFNISDIWQRINAIAIIREDIPDPYKIVVKATLLPNSFKWFQGVVIFQKLFSFIIPIYLISFSPSYFIIWIILGTVIYNFSYFSNRVNNAKQQRQNNYNNAKILWNAFEKRWKAEASSEILEEKKAALNVSKTRYERLSEDYNIELKRLRQRMEELQLHKFLSNYFIHNHSIPNIGDNRKSTLSSYGIDTAADIEKLNKIKVPGFGTFLEGHLINWRNNLARRFKFDPSKGIDPEEVNKLNKKFENTKIQLQNDLRNGAEVLTRIKNRLLHSRTNLRAEGLTLASKLAQAKADIDNF